MGVMVIFGLSGSGKSFLLCVILGFEDVVGCVVFDGDVWLDIEKWIKVLLYVWFVGFMF